MREITVIDSGGVYFKISSDDAIHVTLPSVSTVSVISDDDIEAAYDLWKEERNYDDGLRAAFFAGAKFVMNGGKL